MDDSPARRFLIANAADFVGQELAVSEWDFVDQARIDRFAEATRHTHWLHTDPERARRDSPYGGTVAHGFFMLSLLNHFIDACDLRPEDSAFALNYGVDRVRFLAPVPIGDGFRIRDRITLMETELRPRGLFARTGHSLEIEGMEKPAVVAEYLAIWVQKTA